MSNLGQKIEVLKTKIIDAFSDTIFPGEKNLLYKGGYDDDSEILDFYGLEEWQSIPDKTIEYNNASLSFFSPEAYQFYLPRYLIYILEHYDSNDIVVDKTIYSLTPNLKIDIKDTKEFLANHGNDIELQIRKLMEKTVSHFEAAEEDDDLVEFSISKYKHLTNEQKKVIISFLEFINNHLLEYIDEVAVKSALDYWYNEIAR